jgi:acyl-CoA thioesterase FadM
MQNYPDISRRVIAHNDAMDSGNPMHNDAAAKAMNLKGALVPGITVFGYMTHNLITAFGNEWLDRGSMQVRFRRPVYANETLTIDSRDSGDGHSVNIDTRNPDGEVCVTGRGSMSLDLTPLPKEIATYRDLPDPLWPATREKFSQVQNLGTLRAEFPLNESDGFLTAMQDDLDVYSNGAMHPAWLLRQANIVVDRNFDLGPWIHVESEVQNHSRAKNTDRIEVRAQVVELFERKGHEYFDLDVALLANGDTDRLVMRVLHRAIYKMAETA